MSSRESATMLIAMLFAARVAAASTPPVDLTSPAAAAAALQAMGYRADLSKDAQGGFRIASGNATAQFGIDFRDCHPDGHCAGVVLIREYASDPRYQPTIGAAWNAGQHTTIVAPDNALKAALQAGVPADKVADQRTLGIVIHQFLEADADFQRFMEAARGAPPPASAAPGTVPAAAPKPAPVAPPPPPPPPQPAPPPKPQGPPPVDIANPESVAAALRGLGYRADMSKDVFGNARIASGNDYVQFGVDFHGCQDNGRCVLVMLVKSYADDARYKSEKGDAWNDAKHPSSVGMDGEFHPALQFPISLEKVTNQTALEDAIHDFIHAQAEFEQFLGS